MKKIFLLVVLVAIGIKANAQTLRIVAVSTTGVLTQHSDIIYGRGDYKQNISGRDSVTAEKVKNIFALNALLIDAKDELFRAKVTGFKMTVYDKTGEHFFDSTTEMLTPEMKEQLQKIQRGDKLYFEFIKTEMPDGTRPAATPLGFAIR